LQSCRENKNKFIDWFNGISMVRHSFTT
jgi:hypothetical protein